MLFVLLNFLKRRLRILIIIFYFVSKPGGIRLSNLNFLVENMFVN